MGIFTQSLAVLVIAVGITTAQYGHYSTWRFNEIDSEEHGQYKGPVSTNCTCGTTNKANGRIVGGRVTNVNEYPHMAGLARETRSGGLSLFCGSTIITPHHVLTAAHCTEDIPRGTRLAVLVGGHDLGSANRHTKVYDVDAHFEHESYNSRTFENDIALLVVMRKMTFGEAVGPACLPTKSMNKALVGDYVKVTGWGDTSFQGEISPQLLKVNLRVVPLDQCAAMYPRNPMSLSSPSQFCTFRPRKDSCQGDSGGPVTWLDPDTNRYTLVGVVSFGRGCATDAPGVNTDVYAFMPWIQGMIARTVKYTTSGTATTCARTR